MKRKSIKRIPQGKKRIIFNNQKIRIEVYKDYELAFIMAKEKRIDVRYSKRKGWYAYEGN